MPQRQPLAAPRLRPFADRRRDPRGDARELQVELISEPVVRLFGVRDMSVGGFAVYCDGPLPPGFVGEFLFRTPDGQTYAVRASVMNSRPSREPTGPFITGWAFEQTPTLAEGSRAHPPKDAD